VFNAEERPFQSSICNWQYPARGEDGELLAWSIDSGACIGGSTSSEYDVIFPSFSTYELRLVVWCV